jgi:hypothetical protein
MYDRQIRPFAKKLALEVYAEKVKNGFFGTFSELNIVVFCNLARPIDFFCLQ